MPENSPFNILSNQPNKENIINGAPGRNPSFRQQAQARYERLWLIDPERFDPQRNCMEKLRLKRTMQIVNNDKYPLAGKVIADLGCGSGYFSRQLSSLGAAVDAVDISTIALKLVNENQAQLNIRTIHDYVPRTHLEDDHYDGVFACELIALLPEVEYRLFFAEACRLVKREGWFVFSSPIDIDSEDALTRLLSLAETEFDIQDYVFGYHRLYIRLCNFFELPSSYIAAADNPECKKELLDKRQGFSKKWFDWNSSAPLSFFWRFANIFSAPFLRFIKQNHWLLTQLEKLTQFFYHENGISHAIILAHRRPLVAPPPADEMPIERRPKRSVWE